MFKAKYINVILFIYVKYFLYYVLLMILQNQIYLFQFYKMKTAEDIQYFLFMYNFFPVLNIVLLSFPIYLVLKKEISSLVLILLAGIEFYLHVQLTATIINDYSIYNSIISIFVFPIFFWKTLFKKKTDDDGL